MIVVTQLRRFEQSDKLKFEIDISHAKRRTDRCAPLLLQNQTQQPGGFLIDAAAENVAELFPYILRQPHQFGV